MTSRDRVLAALVHTEPDRVPVSFGDLCFSTIIDYPPHGYRALCQHLGLSDYPEPVSSPNEDGCVLNIDERLRVRFRADIRTIAAGSSHDVEYLPDGGSVDDWGLVRHKTGSYWNLDDTQAPLRHARSLADVDAFSGWPDTRDPAIWRGKREEAQAIRDAGFAVSAVPSTAMQIGHNYAFTRGFELYLMDMIEDPSFWHGFAERLTDWAIDYVTAFLTPIADLVDLVIMGEDMGTQRALFMSPNQYRAFLKPYHRRWAEAVHRIAPHAKIALHSCGSIYPIIRDFIEIGVEVLNPVQPKAASMEPWRLKKEFGRDLTFLGGLDVQDLLPHGTPEQVRAGTRDLIETLGPGGGFILAPSHQFQPDVPSENIAAMYDTAAQQGRYPLDLPASHVAAS
jgi:uroporphyrinogen decarboxylase